MKSKATTYVLIAAAIAVWGFIAWKIFSPKTDPVTIAPPTVRKGVIRDESETILVCDYEDPFLKDAATPRAVIQPSPLSNREAAAVPPKKPEPPKAVHPLKYTGTIRAGGRVSYLFDHDGLQHALSPGQVLAGYTLEKTWQDSVGLSLDGESFTVHLQN